MIVERREETEVLSRMIMLLEVAEHCFRQGMDTVKDMALHDWALHDECIKWVWDFVTLLLKLLLQLIRDISEAQLSVWQALTSCEVLGWLLCFTRVGI